MMLVLSGLGSCDILQAEHMDLRCRRKVHMLSYTTTSKALASNSFLLLLVRHLFLIASCYY